jgi:hypothetical protein
MDGAAINITQAMTNENFMPYASLPPCTSRVAGIMIPLHSGKRTSMMPLAATTGTEIETGKPQFCSASPQ